MTRRKDSAHIPHPFWRRLVMGTVWGAFALFMLWIFISVTLGVMRP